MLEILRSYIMQQMEDTYERGFDASLNGESTRWISFKYDALCYIYFKLLRS